MILASGRVPPIMNPTCLTTKILNVTSFLPIRYTHMTLELVSGLREREAAFKTSILTVE